MVKNMLLHAKQHEGDMLTVMMWICILAVFTVVPAGTQVVWCDLFLMWRTHARKGKIDGDEIWKGADSVVCSWGNFIYVKYTNENACVDQLVQCFYFNTYCTLLKEMSWAKFCCGYGIEIMCFVFTDVIWLYLQHMHSSALELKYYTHKTESI